MAEFNQETIGETSEANTKKFKAELFLAMFNNFYISRVKQSLYIHAAARTVLDLKPRHRVTPALRELHWLSVTERF